jgi:hypothetical protein
VDNQKWGKGQSDQSMQERCQKKKGECHI